MSENSKRDVFAFRDYRLYIRADIAAHRGERGYQKKLAEAAQCRPSKKVTLAEGLVQTKMYLDNLDRISHREGHLLIFNRSEASVRAKDSAASGEGDAEDIAVFWLRIL